MKVRELMSRPVHTCSPTDSLASAAKLLWDHDCGILPVVDARGRVGATITDRDICMGAFTRGRALADLRVSDSMSREIVTCRPDDDIGTAASKMVQHRVRRLPVVDGEGKPCGVLSLNDLALASEREPAAGQESLRVLLAVCQRNAAVVAVPPRATPANRVAAAT